MVERETLPEIRAETDLGYPRSRGAKLVMASCVVADPDGIKLDGRGRRTYTWSQIARFETDTHPKSGDAFGALVLVDGRRMELHALLEEKGIDGHERAAHPVEVADRIRTLNRLLEQSRARA